MGHRVRGLGSKSGIRGLGDPFMAKKWKELLAKTGQTETPSPLYDTSKIYEMNKKRQMQRASLYL